MWNLTREGAAGVGAGVMSKHVGEAGRTGLATLASLSSAMVAGLADGAHALGLSGRQPERQDKGAASAALHRDGEARARAPASSAGGGTKQPSGVSSAGVGDGADGEDEESGQDGARRQQLPPAFAAAPSALVDLAVAGAAASVAAAGLVEAQAEAQALSKAMKRGKAAPHSAAASRTAAGAGAGAPGSQSGGGAPSAGAAGADAPRLGAPERPSLNGSTAGAVSQPPPSLPHPHKRQRKVLPTRARTGAGEDTRRRDKEDAQAAAKKHETGAGAEVGGGGGEQGGQGEVRVEVVPPAEPRRKRFRLVFNQDISVQSRPESHGSGGAPPASGGGGSTRP